MPIQFFKSKKSSTPKGNTMKKTETIDGRQTRRDFHNENHNCDEGVVDISSVSDWIKEGKPESPSNDKEEQQAVLWSMAGPRHATLVEGVPARSDVANGGDSIVIEQKSEPQTASLVPTTHDVITNPPPQQMADLLLGQRHSTSRYFTQNYVRMPIASLSTLSSPSSPINCEGNKLVPLIYIDPQAFALYQIWLHTGAIPSQWQEASFSSSMPDAKYMWQVCWPLMNAHILGCTIGALEFSDQVVDFLQVKIDKTVCADVDTINHLFSAEIKGIPDVLKRFVVDRCIDAGIDGGLANLHIPDLPPSFAHFMLETALQRLSSTTSRPRVFECEYHTHKTRDMCYKIRIPPADLRRVRRFECEPEMSRKLSEEVGANPQLSGIKTSDWEERRAEANRALGEQTGKRWTGFSRLGDHRPGITETMNGPGTTTVQSGRLPSDAAGAEVKCKSLIGELFGTAQTSDAVDNVLVRAPSREAPSPPNPVTAIYATRRPDLLSDYQLTAPGPSGGITPATSAVNDGNASLTSGLHSNQLKSDLELHHNMAKELEYEPQSVCPGTFPISRTGSTRSVVP